MGHKSEVEGQTSDSTPDSRHSESLRNYDDNHGVMMFGVIRSKRHTSLAACGMMFYSTQGVKLFRYIRSHANSSKVSAGLPLTLFPQLLMIFLLKSFQHQQSSLFPGLDLPHNHWKSKS